MNILITCSLEGRDLAVVKSMLNIQKEYAGVKFKYTDASRKGQILIVKDYQDEGAIYYALNRQNGNKTPILPNLNPKSLKELFKAIARKVDGKNNGTETFDQLKPFENILFEFMHANSGQHLLVEQGQDSLYFDKVQNSVSSTAPVINQIETLKTEQKDLQVTIHTEPFEADKALSHTMALDLFCWHFGMSMDAKILTEHKFKDPKFKLISWPNYGEFEFQQEFIYLSSLIWKSAETMSEILERTGFEQPQVYQFLNAGLLTGHVTVFKNDHGTTTQPKAKTISGFLSGVKKVFGF